MAIGVQQQAVPASASVAADTTIEDDATVIAPTVVAARTAVDVDRDVDSTPPASASASASASAAASSPLSRSSSHVHADGGHGAAISSIHSPPASHPAAASVVENDESKDPLADELLIELTSVYDQMEKSVVDDSAAIQSNLHSLLAASQSNVKSFLAQVLACDRHLLLQVARSSQKESARVAVLHYTIQAFTVVHGALTAFHKKTSSVPTTIKDWVKILASIPQMRRRVFSIGTYACM